MTKKLSVSQLALLREAADSDFTWSDSARTVEALRSRELITVDRKWSARSLISITDAGRKALEG